MLSLRWRSATYWALLTRTWLELAVPLGASFLRSNRKRRTKVPKTNWNLFATIAIRYKSFPTEQVFQFHSVINWIQFKSFFFSFNEICRLKKSLRIFVPTFWAFSRNISSHRPPLENPKSFTTKCKNRHCHFSLLTVCVLPACLSIQMSFIFIHESRNRLQYWFSLPYYFYCTQKCMLRSSHDDVLFF